MSKTNAQRILETAGINYATYEYDASDGKLDGISVAAKIGRNSDTVYKTLVTVGKTMGINVFIIPSERELNLKKAAAAAGDKHVEMIKLKELLPLTGYIHGGCSPIGMKKAFPSFIDETAKILIKIIVSAGRVGMQMELAPDDLARITKAAFADLV